MDDRTSILAPLVALMIATAFVTPVMTQENATINVTVTISQLGVEVSPATYDFGLMNLNDVASTSADYFSVTNTGNVPSNMTMKATNTSNWRLSPSPGADAFTLEYRLDTTWIPLTTSPVIFAENIGPGENETFALQMKTPTSTTSYGQQSTTITIGVVAA